MDDPANNPVAKPHAKRRWYQFSLWSMFVWVTVIGVGLAVGVLWVAPAQQQRAVVQMVERLGGGVTYSDPPANEGRLTTWLREWLPRDYFDAVYEVDLRSYSVAVADLRSLASQTQLEYLWLNDTQVSDGGLTHLSGLTQLRHLSLIRTAVTDAGVAELRKALPNCVIVH